MYLQSCAHCDPQALDLTALDWTDWLNKIALNEFLAFPPYWLDTIDDNNNNNKRNSNNGSSTGTDKKARASNNDEQMYLQTWEPGARLQPTESYQKVFHVQNKLGISPLLANNSTPMCHKFYATGQCKRSCRRSHSPLDEDEKRTWRSFIDHCKERYHSFINNMGRPNRTPTNQTQYTHTRQQTPNRHSPRPPTPTQSKNDEPN